MDGEESDPRFRFNGSSCVSRCYFIDPQRAPEKSPFCNNSSWTPDWPKDSSQRRFWKPGKKRREVVDRQTGRQIWTAETTGRYEISKTATTHYDKSLDAAIGSGEADARSGGSGSAVA